MRIAWRRRPVPEPDVNPLGVAERAPLTEPEWPGMILRQRLDAPVVAVDGTVLNGAPEGKLQIVLGDQQVDVPLVTAGSLDPPGLMWRLLRINF